MRFLLVLFFIPLVFSQDEDLGSLEVSDISPTEFDRYFDQVLSRASDNELDAVNALQKAVTKCTKDKDQISCIVPEYASIVIKYGLEAEFKKTIVEAIKRKQVFKSDGSPRVNNVDI
ncbi:hypothetical protein PRIPAC_82669 [Pristionchus pacificus]|uniref:Uncharacterized protein n=1 Tax=Pristionchus pacificus TaxID=54126 RepID=A0A454Y5N3_PRIPA|nr:hypothetical protein PRIPAC_82669 [Pristionchus pacificus]|eukprot:PDM72168.1 hypothetical protein PRIPAC_38602 [Pristionchus pacificus]